jgi:adenylate cyclase
MMIPARQAVYQVGAFTLDCGNEQLRTTEGAEIPLRAKSLALLRLMVENAGHLLTRATIMDALWSNVVVTDDSITQCVGDIRHALGPNWLHLLRTIRRRGYIFEASAVRRDPADALPVVDQDGDSRTRDTARPDEHALSRAKVTLHTLGSADRGCSRTGPPVRLSVLVLPLRSLDGSDVRELLAERITEDIVTDLARYLNNLAPGEARVFFHDNRLTHWRSESRDPPADYVLRGGVQGVHQTCMSLQLLDATNGGCIWSERCELFGQRDQIARLIRTIAIVLVRDVGRRIEALPGSTMTARDVVLRGWAWQQRPASPTNRRQALRCFEAAIAMDVDSVGARLGIATVLIGNVANGWSQAVRQDMARGEALMREVFQADLDIAFAHVVHGTLRRLQGRLQESRVELEMATDLAPHSPMAASQKGFTLAFLGRPEAAVPQVERSVRLAPRDPQTPLLLNNLGMCRLLLGDIDTATERLRESIVGNPDLSATHWLLAAALGFRSASAEAGAHLRRAAELFPAVGTLAGLRTWVTMQAGPDFMPLYGHMIERGLRQAGMPEA